MANQRILAIVTALVMLGTTASSQQNASISELREIEFLVSNQRWAQLHSMIVNKPTLLQGSDPLSVELREFVRQVSLGRVAGLAPALRQAPATTEPNDPSVVSSRASTPNIY